MLKKLTFVLRRTLIFFLAQERDIWWSIIVDGAITSESDRVKEAENKRQLRKSRVNDNSTMFVTECSMHEFDSLVICAPINLRYSFTAIMDIIIFDGRT